MQGCHVMGLQQVHVAVARGVYACSSTTPGTSALPAFQCDAKQPVGAMRCCKYAVQCVAGLARRLLWQPTTAGCYDQQLLVARWAWWQFGVYQLRCEGQSTVYTHLAYSTQSEPLASCRNNVLGIWACEGLLSTSCSMLLWCTCSRVSSAISSVADSAKIVLTCNKDEPALGLHEPEARVLTLLSLDG